MLEISLLVTSKTGDGPLSFECRSDMLVITIATSSALASQPHAFLEGEPSRWSPSPRTPTRQNPKPAVCSPAAPTRQKEHEHTGCLTWMACFFSYLLAIYASGRDACLVPQGHSCLSRRHHGVSPAISLTGSLTDSLTDVTDTCLSLPSPGLI